MADGQNPFMQFGGIQPTQDIRNQAYGMRVMSMMNHLDPMPRTPRYAGGARGGGRSPFGNVVGSDTPDYSMFTNDPAARAAASQYLGQYGLSPLAPQDVQHNAVLPNSGFFGRHPMLSSALEGGMFGGAMTQGADTWGEGISNVMRGMIEGPQARQTLLNRQYARPFEAASMLEGLQDRSQKRELQAAEIEHYRALNQKLGRPDHDFREFNINRNTPMIGMYDNTTGESKFLQNPLYDPTQPREGTSPEDQYIATKEAEFAKAGKAPTGEDRAAWHHEWAKQGHITPQGAMWVGPDGKVYGLKPGDHLPTGALPLNRSPLAGGVSPQQQREDRITKTKSDWLQKSLADPKKTFLYTGKLPNEPGVKDDLNKYFDENIAPSLPKDSPMPGAGQGGVLIYNQETGTAEEQ